MNHYMSKPIDKDSLYKNIVALVSVWFLMVEQIVQKPSQNHVFQL
jgi:hypothetical protein